MSDCRKKINRVREGRVFATLVVLGGVAVALIAFLLISNTSPKISKEEMASIEKTREIFNLLADEKYTEVFTRIKSSDEMVLSYLRAVLYDKGYGASMNVNVHASKTWRDLKEMERLRKNDAGKARKLDIKYEVLRDLIEKKANEREPIFQILMAYLTRLGIGCKADKPEAARWYRLAINDNNDPLAMCELGRMLTSPIGGIEKNNREAYEFFKRAAEQGYAEGESQLANIAYSEKRKSLERFIDIEIMDDQEATIRYNELELRSAQKGRILSMQYFASIYFLGVHGVKINYQKEYMWTYLEWLNRKEINIFLNNDSLDVFETQKNRALRDIEKRMDAAGMDVRSSIAMAVEEAEDMFTNQAKYLQRRK